MPGLQGAIVLDSQQRRHRRSEGHEEAPDAVKLAAEAVCLMMGVKPDKIKDPNGGQEN